MALVVFADKGNEAVRVRVGNPDLAVRLEKCQYAPLDGMYGMLEEHALR